LDQLPISGKRASANSASAVEIDPAPGIAPLNQQTALESNYLQTEVLRQNEIPINLVRSTMAGNYLLGRWREMLNC
jgi:hypothetical protein